MKFEWRSPLDWLAVLSFVAGLMIAFYTVSLRHP